MLPASHYRAYQDFLSLLTEFNGFLANSAENMEKTQVKLQFERLDQWFELNIASLDSQNLDSDIINRWQSLQTEIRREFKLLTTGILFFASARQNNTKVQKLQNLKDYTTKLISYCQIMLQKYEE